MFPSHTGICWLDNAIEEGWLFVDNDGDGQTFQRKNIYCLTSYGCNGGNLEFLSSWSYYYDSIFGGNPSGAAGELDNWLISPEISIPDSGLCAVEWGDWSFTNMNGDQYKLLISPTGNEDISSFTYEVADVTVVNGGTSYFATLNDFAGQTIRIAFWHYGSQDATQGGAVFLDYLEVYQLGEPIWWPTLYFYFSAGRVGESMVKHTNILAPQSTEDITATSSNPALYLVSSDGIEFAETANFASTGGTLYVQFSPQEIGEFEGDAIIISHNSTTKTIELYGEATDCRNIETPYTETFAEDANEDFAKNSVWCWDLMNEDPANTNSAPYISGYSNGGNFILFTSRTAFAGGNYNQWAITPELHTTPMYEELPLDHFAVSFTYSAYDYPTYQRPEVFAVAYSSTDKDFASFTFGDTITVETADISPYTTTLPANTKYVAIKYMTNWGDRLFVADFSIIPIYDAATQGLISNQVFVFPNPVKNELKITNYELRDGEMIQIYNTSGQLVETRRAVSSINISNLPNGTYIVKVGNKTAKIVKE
jgi:hypothetical protein